MFITKAYSAQSETSPLAPFSFQRRDPRPQDVQIEILYCGVCHSDLHQVRNEWHNTTYPCVPGHEIIGRVVKVGNEVKKFKSGNIAAVDRHLGAGCREIDADGLLVSRPCCQPRFPWRRQPTSSLPRNRRLSRPSPRFRPRHSKR